MNQRSQSICLFGARTPLLDDYLESCLRLELSVENIISVSGEKTRFVHQQPATALQDINPQDNHSPFLAAAFSPLRRQELVSLASQCGLEPAAAVVDPTSVVASSSVIGKGSYINVMSAVASVTRIGEHVFINRSCNIGHHSLIGDFVSFGPGVTAASNIRIGERAVIGAGAVLLPGVTIGSGSVVSAGTRIHQDIPADHLAIGVQPTIKPIKEGKRLVYYPGQE